MSSSVLVDPTVPPTRRRSRLGIAARVGIFAGAAGVALLSVAGASASASPIRVDNDDAVPVRHIPADADDFVNGRRVVVDADDFVSAHHAVRSRNVSTRWSVTTHVATASTSWHVAPAQPVVTSSSPGGTWACIRQHESGGNYAINTGNGYYGAYQFSLSTWRSVGGTGLPSQASPAEQDMRAQILQARDGWAPWPQTSRMCGV